MADSPTSTSGASHDDSTRPGERYSEQEMALILKRAAELQEGADGRGVHRSLAEIQDIAAEAGIEPAFVTEAVAELHRPRARIGWLGAPTRFHEEQKVTRKLTPAEIGGLLDQGRRVSGFVQPVKIQTQGGVRFDQRGFFQCVQLGTAAARQRQIANVE